MVVLTTTMKEAQFSGLPMITGVVPICTCATTTGVAMPTMKNLRTSVQKSLVARVVEAAGQEKTALTLNKRMMKTRSLLKRMKKKMKMKILNLMMRKMRKNRMKMRTRSKMMRRTRILLKKTKIIILTMKILNLMMMKIRMIMRTMIKKSLTFSFKVD